MYPSVSPKFSCFGRRSGRLSVLSLLISGFGRRNITCVHVVLFGEDIEGQFESAFPPFLRWACGASMFSIFRHISPNEDGWALYMTVAHLFREVHHLFGDRPPALRRVEIWKGGVNFDAYHYPVCFEDWIESFLQTQTKAWLFVCKIMRAV